MSTEVENYVVLPRGSFPLRLVPAPSGIASPPSFSLALLDLIATPKKAFGVLVSGPVSESVNWSELSIVCKVQGMCLRLLGGAL